MVNIQGLCQKGTCVLQEYLTMKMNRRSESAVVGPDGFQVSCLSVHTVCKENVSDLDHLNSETPERSSVAK